MPTLDTVILQLDAKFGDYNAKVAGAADGTERALSRIQTASTKTERALASQRQGLQQLGYQLNDISTLFALGARPQQIFASQMGQTLQAVQLMTGGTSKLAAFLGGPWGGVERLD